MYTSYVAVSIFETTFASFSGMMYILIQAHLPPVYFLKKTIKAIILKVFVSLWNQSV